MKESEHRSDRAAARDRGLRRAARAKGWLAVLAIGLTVALSAVAAEALPGTSRRHIAAAVRPASTLSSASGPMAPNPTVDDPAPSAAPEGESAGADSGSSGSGDSASSDSGSGDSGASSSDSGASDPAASAPLQPPPEPPVAAPSDQSSGAVSGGS